MTCGTANPENAKFCIKCGAGVTPGVVPQQAIFAAPAGGYGAAVAPAVDNQPKREGNLLLVPPRGAVLPQSCVKCGQPPTKVLKKTYYWQNPLLALLILLGILGIVIYAIVTMIVRKPAYLEVPLCDQHDSSRKTRLWIGAILLILWLPVGIGLIAVQNDTTTVLGVICLFVFFIAGIVFLSIAPPLKPKFIDERIAKFKGCGPAFLNQIAPM